ncbi:uncharacterized protein LOC129941630 [Eupeodes corollae]|uniref:uncharacterized protein LOC129941630 n=1 Tax=Eupeodes corollae TaxID=290404 RepID=UPI0024939751|nr:uncharacterized protein LOC129941630 [Eupeodes corollae]
MDWDTSISNIFTRHFFRTEQHQFKFTKRLFEPLHLLRYVFNELTERIHTKRHSKTIAIRSKCLHVCYSVSINKENKMTNANKLNSMQKSIMAEFMATHPGLAQNLITNSAQGKAIAEELWATLTNQLNDVGPPFKDAKTWKKVFADQKYQAKKKLSFNITLKHNKRGDYLYEQKRISLADQQILEASGLKLSNQVINSTLQIQTQPSRTSSPIFCSEGGTAVIKVESNDSVDSFISLESTHLLDRDTLKFDYDEEKNNDSMLRRHFSQEESIQSSERELRNEHEESTYLTNTQGDNEERLEEDESREESHQIANIYQNNKKRKLNLEEEHTAFKFVHENMSSTQSEFQQRIESKLDRLLDIQERMLKIKEEKHKSVIALNLIKLQIKTMELDKLKASQ